MKNLVLFIALLQLLNLAIALSVRAKEPVVVFEKGAEFRVTCEVEKGADEQAEVSWEKDNIKLETKPDKVLLEASPSNYSVRVLRGNDDDAGYYTCLFSVNGKVQNKTTMLASSSIDVETQDNLNVVEGEKLRITCQVSGKPTPTITWQIGDDVYSNSTGIVKLQEDAEKKIPNAVLIIENVNMTNRGNYTCRGHSAIQNKTVVDHTLVRIKDKYAALWPFLGICLEVFVLCAIILIYEKKRNKSELEESDTDQSPDQKNTPDHGKDSNLRHRQ
ncbi:Immunoglobulin I-set domain [Popillia japonica]|uniref:Immunoglobulin I-set domain n=1 Tax=Popillia japonica TaxID=7064 RepID=A0AAW1L521_POPJA